MIDSGQFTLHATFLAREGQYARMAEICRESLAITSQAPGLQQALCLEPPGPDKPFVFISIWRSRADFIAFQRSPAMQTFHSKAAVEQMFATAMAEATADFYSIMDVAEATR